MDYAKRLSLAFFITMLTFAFYVGQAMYMVFH